MRSLASSLASGFNAKSPKAHDVSKAGRVLRSGLSSGDRQGHQVNVRRLDGGVSAPGSAENRNLPRVSSTHGHDRRSLWMRIRQRFEGPRALSMATKQHSGFDLEPQVGSRDTLCNGNPPKGARRSKPLAHSHGS